MKAQSALNLTKIEQKNKAENFCLINKKNFLKLTLKIFRTFTQQFKTKTSYLESSSCLKYAWCLYCSTNFLLFSSQPFTSKYCISVSKTSCLPYPGGKSFSTRLYSKLGSRSFWTVIPKALATVSMISKEGLIPFLNEFT